MRVVIDHSATAYCDHFRDNGSAQQRCVKAHRSLKAGRDTKVKERITLNIVIKLEQINKKIEKKTLHCCPV